MASASSSLSLAIRCLRSSKGRAWNCSAAERGEELVFGAGDVDIELLARRVSDSQLLHRFAVGPLAHPENDVGPDACIVAFLVDFLELLQVPFFIARAEIVQQLLRGLRPQRSEEHTSELQS